MGRKRHAFGYGTGPIGPIGPVGPIGPIGPIGPTTGHIGPTTGPSALYTDTGDDDRGRATTMLKCPSYADCNEMIGSDVSLFGPLLVPTVGTRDECIFFLAMSVQQKKPQNAPHREMGHARPVSFLFFCRDPFFLGGGPNPQAPLKKTEGLSTKKKQNATRGFRCSGASDRAPSGVDAVQETRKHAQVRGALRSGARVWLSLICACVWCGTY